MSECARAKVSIACLSMSECASMAVVVAARDPQRKHVRPLGQQQLEGLEGEYVFSEVWVTGCDCPRVCVRVCEEGVCV